MTRESIKVRKEANHNAMTDSPDLNSDRVDCFRDASTEASYHHCLKKKKGNVVLMKKARETFDKKKQRRRDDHERHFQ